MYIALRKTVEPALEPVSLEEAKDHLRVLGSDEDDYITALISVAREFVETITGRSLITQTWLVTFDSFCGTRLYLPRPPVQSVTSVQYRDTTDGSLQTHSDSLYEVNLVSEPSAIRFDELPNYDIEKENPIQVTFVSGYGDAATDVPRNLVHAIKLLIGHWYTNRSSVANARDMDPKLMPVAVEALTVIHKYNHHER